MERVSDFGEDNQRQRVILEKKTREIAREKERNRARKR